MFLLRICYDYSTEQQNVKYYFRKEAVFMIMQIPGSTAAPLFDGWEETLIWSALDGIMGACYALTANHPESALIVQGDFFFFAGKPEPALIPYIPEGWSGSCRLLTPPNEEWAAVIEAVLGPQAQRETRYAIRKEHPGIFEEKRLLEAIAAAPARIVPIEERLYRQCLEEDWSRDLVSRYPTFDEFSRLALGYAAVSEGKILSGAACYCTYADGIEVEIDTHPDHRRKGLAYGCGAALILECAKRGLYPSWDAANPGSVALAEKLGYHFSHEYPVYYVPIGNANP